MLVYTTKECSYMYNSIVIVHQHGGYDVTCKQKHEASALEAGSCMHGNMALIQLNLFVICRPSVALTLVQSSPLV